MAINYLNGKWVEEKDMIISALDLSVLRGFGVFDFLRTYGKTPFKLKEHIERFFNSAKIIGMHSIKNPFEIEEIVLAGIEKNRFENTTIKIVQTGGVSVDGFIPSGEPSFFVIFSPLTELTSKMYEDGIKLLTANLKRQLPYAKTLSYIAGIVEVQKAMKVGAKDILYIDNTGNIYEATRANFFAIKNNELITADKDILFGITRKVILEIAEKAGLKPVLRFLNTVELNEIDEAFISSSSYELMPVTNINNVIIDSGKCGGKTMRLMEEFKKITNIIY